MRCEITKITGGRVPWSNIELLMWGNILVSRSEYEGSDEPDRRGQLLAIYSPFPINGPWSLCESLLGQFPSYF